MIKFGLGTTALALMLSTTLVSAEEQSVPTTEIDKPVSTLIAEGWNPIDLEQIYGVTTVMLEKSGEGITLCKLHNREAGLTSECKLISAK